MNTGLVIFLAQHSLLSGGIASKLGELSTSLRIQCVDIEQENVQESLTRNAPAYIILDANDPGICQNFPILRLLEWAPGARIIRLDATSDSVRIFSSQEYRVSQTKDLFHIIQSLSGTQTAI